jgi:hypothetical protein
MGRLVERTRESVLKSMGGASDPYGLVQDLNAKLGVKLTPQQAADLIVELLSEPVRQHIGYLLDAAKELGPNVLADVQGTGTTTTGSAQVAQGSGRRSRSFRLLHRHASPARRWSLPEDDRHVVEVGEIGLEEGLADPILTRI